MSVMLRNNFKFDAVVRLVVLTACFVCVSNVAAQEVVFPIGSGVINVKAAPYNAVGDGVADDTAALQSAINAARTNLGGRTVYLPNGIYKVSNTLVLTEYDAANTSCAHRTFTLQGQSRDGVVIKLVDNANGFDATSRKAVINTFRPTTIVPPCTPTAPAAQNFTNSAFSTNIQNLTVDTGAGNPGATGINYIANNQGSLRDVLIRTSDAERAGFSGLDLALSRIAGPAFIKNLTVEGFDYGIRALEAQYSTVYENITLRHQNRAGIYNQAHVLSIRRLSSENQVSAIRQVPAVAPTENPEPGGYGNSAIGFSKGLITLIDSNLTGGASNNPAIDIQDGYLFARNITTAGYADTISDQGTTISGTTVKEYRTGNKTYKAFEDSPDRSLNLEIRDTPEVAIDNLANESLRCLPANVPCAPGTWASVKDFGATQNDRLDDDTEEIQAALDSGATTVFFSNSATNEGNSRYNVTRTLTVGGNVRSVMGNSCSITVSSPLTGGGAVFKFVESNQPTRLIENFRHHVSAGSQHFVEQASEQTLVIRNMLIRRGFAYRNTGFGDVYIEDFHNLLNGTDNLGPSFIFKNQRVWARQINPEVGSPEIVNDGATVWILGLKTEQQSTLVETKNAGKTEILGGLSLISRTGQTAVSTAPAFINNNSSVSIVHTEYRQNPTRGFFPNVIQETRAEETQTLTYADLPSRPAAFPTPTPSTPPTPYTTEAYVVPLYTGYAKPIPTINVADKTVVYNGAPQTATGTVIGVNDEELGAPTFTYNDSPNAPVDAGIYTVVATFPGDANYAPATATATLVIERSATAFVNLAEPSIIYGTTSTVLSGQIVAAGALVPPGTVLITLNNATQLAAIDSDGTFAVSFATGDLAPGNSPYIINYVYEGNINFAPTTGVGKLTVRYRIRALYDQSKENNSGSTVPIKLQLVRADGINVSSPEILVKAIDILQVNSNATFPVMSSGDSNPNNIFRFEPELGETGGYIFNLKTTRLPAGTYNLRFQIGADPTLYVAEFRIR